MTNIDDLKCCRLWNLYGPAESTIAWFDVHFARYDDKSATRQHSNRHIPLPNYRCIIKDEFSQNVIIDQEGELLV